MMVMIVVTAVKCIRVYKDISHKSISHENVVDSETCFKLIQQKMFMIQSLKIVTMMKALMSN